MTSRDFCYWLQGYFEIGCKNDDVFSSAQVEIVKRHLALVFKHEIDPSIDKGDPTKKAALDAIHGASTGRLDYPPTVRC